MKTWTKKGTTKAQYALDAATGSILWKVYTGDNSATAGHYNWSSPLIYNGYAYIGVASLGDCPLVQGQLLRVDLNTHQIVNIFNVVPTGQVGGGIWTSACWGPVPGCDLERWHQLYACARRHSEFRSAKYGPRGSSY